MSEDMATLARLAENQLRAELEVELAELQLKKAKDRLRTISETQVPEVMDRLQLETFKTQSGLVITVKEQIRASIPKAKLAQAISWLRANGHGRLIKRTMSVIPADEDQAKLLHKQLKGFEVSDIPKVHPQTLGAWARELLEDGVDFPMDLFGIHRQRVSKVKV
jgi:hypothetical protein